MKLSEKLASGKFVVTGEVGPPKGVDIKEMLDGAERLRGLVDAINVTDIQSSVMRVGSLAVCHLLKDRGFETVFQMTCRDRNRLALQSDLLSAHLLGIENVLCLTGDHTALGDHTGAKPVFDLDSASLLTVAKGLNDGHDMAGNELRGRPDFCLGAVVCPGSDPIEPQLAKMRKKHRAGAEFFQTQAVYDPDVFKRFRDMTRDVGAPVLFGIVVLKSAGMADYMNENVAGVTVPEPLVARMKAAGKGDRAKVAVDIAAEIIAALKDHAEGVHIMTLGWDHLVGDILRAAGVRA
jgi:5,10-methylenetetrahydrofolate reductase